MINKIKFFLYFKRFHFPGNKEKHISVLIKESKHITFILPEEEESITASLIIPEYYKNRGKKIQAVFINTSNSAVPVGLFDNTTELAAKEIKKSTLPAKDSQHLLENIDTDIVIDLSRGDKLYYKFTARTINAGFIIGAQKEDAEKFYHFVYRSEETAPAEFYKNFLSCLQMFNGNS